MQAEANAEPLEAVETAGKARLYGVLATGYKTMQKRAKTGVPWFGTTGLTQRKSFRFNRSGCPLVEPCGFHARNIIYNAAMNTEGNHQLLESRANRWVSRRVEHLVLGPAKNGAISAGVGQRQRQRLICDGSIGGDAVGTLHQTLHHLRGADRSGFLKIGAQTFLGGDDFPAALLPVLPASLPTFQTPS